MYNIWKVFFRDDKYYANSPDRNPKRPSDGALRVIRGSSWLDSARNCRSAFPILFDPRYRDGSLGFRLLQDLIEHVIEEGGDIHYETPSIRLAAFIKKSDDPRAFIDWYLREMNTKFFFLLISL